MNTPIRPHEIEKNSKNPMKFLRVDGFSTSIAVWVFRGIGGCRQETLHPQVKQHELSRIRFIVVI